MQSPYLIFAVITACLSLGGVLVAVGVLKGKIQHNAEDNKNLLDLVEKLASRDDLSSAVKRVDELLAIIRARAEEDREKGQGVYREFYSLLTGHEKRISALETHQSGLAKALDELKKDIKSGFSDLRCELKELQNEIKEARKQG